MPHRQIPMLVPDDGRLDRVRPVFADARVREFAALGGVLMYRAELESGAIAWSPGLLWRLGYDEAAVEPSVAWWLERTHPDDVATVTAFLSEALEGKHSEWELHYRFRRADGSWAHVEGRARLVRDETGKPVCTEGVVRDVSEQRAAEAALVEREAAYRLLAEEAREFIARHEPDGRYRYVSAAARELTGWEPADLLGHDPYEFFHVDDHVRIREEAHALALRGELGKVGIQYRFRRRDGSYSWFETLTRPIVDAAGTVVELHTSSRDVTDKRALEERLARAQKLEALGMLAGGVAHDFNNLMTIVRGNTELLQDVVSGPEPHALLREVHEATKRAAALTQQLLLLGRREQAVRAPVDVAATVRALVPLAARLAGSRAHVHAEAPDACWVVGDASTIEQVVLNLVANARDAIATSGTIRITAAPVTLTSAMTGGAGSVPPGAWVQLSVSDTGAGMSADVLSRSLEPFFSTRPEGVGGGLGLAAVHAALQRQGGHLTIDSTAGQGTTVTCWLPHVDAPVAAMPRVPVPQDVAERRLPHILVVDDEPSVRAVARRALERRGYTVTTADDGTDALAQLDAGLRPDLVLTDVMMPGMSGRALADVVLARDAALPVVFMSGFAREDLLRDGMLGQDHPMVLKPFMISDLVDAVDGALASR